MSNDLISKGDRDALLIVLRKRDKAMRAIAAQRKAENLAEFERLISNEVHWQEDGTLVKAVEFGADAARQVDHMISERCQELDIPERFRPKIQWSWLTRGENAIKERRVELRLMAKARFDAQEREALAKVEMHSLDVQQRLIASTLTSDEARQFLGSVPTIESLMPPIVESEVKALFDQKPSEEIKRLAQRHMYDA
jgi:hypothetical protein